MALFARASGRFDEALRIHRDSVHLLNDCGDDEVRGKYFEGLAITYQYLGDHNAALVEFAGASYYYEVAGKDRLSADMENNLAVLRVEMGQVDEALAHMDRALGSLRRRGRRPRRSRTRGRASGSLKKILMPRSAARPRPCSDSCVSTSGTCSRLAFGRSSGRGWISSAPRRSSD